MREVIANILEEHGPGTAKQVAKWIGGGIDTPSVAAVLNSMAERDEVRRDLVDEGRTSYHLYSLAKGHHDTRGRLVISRRVNQSISIDIGGREITIVLLHAESSKAQLSVIAPREIRVFRDELLRGEA
jgi:carbon storage regulator CsrA